MTRQKDACKAYKDCYVCICTHKHKMQGNVYYENNHKYMENYFFASHIKSEEKNLNHYEFK